MGQNTSEPEVQGHNPKVVFTTPSVAGSQMSTPLGVYRRRVSQSHHWKDKQSAWKVMANKIMVYPGLR